MQKGIYAFLTALLAFGYSSKAQSVIVDSIYHDGMYRNYRLYVPAIYTPGQAVPLLLNLHGYTSNAAQQELYGNFMPIADTANFIIVHPNGTNTFGGQFWNAFGWASPDDNGFLSALIDSVAAQYSINQDRVYSCGMSNGGIMSYYLACNLNNRIAAIGSVTGTMQYTMTANCTPATPVPVIEIHGTADGTVPYNGSGTSEPIDSVIAFWVNHNNCNPVPAVIPYANTSTGDGCTATEYAYTGGLNGSETVLVKIDGGGHTWPGAPIAIGVTNMDFSASVRIWRFFSRFRKSQFIGIGELQSEFVPLEVYPNPASGMVTLTGLKPRNAVAVYSIVGRQVYTATAEMDQLSIPVSAWPKGTYIVQSGGQAVRLVVL